MVGFVLFVVWIGFEVDKALYCLALACIDGLGLIF